MSFKNRTYYIFFLFCTLTVSAFVKLHPSVLGKVIIRTDSRLNAGLFEKNGIFDKLKPLLGFYAIMLAPIYGIGLPGLGDMTHFETGACVKWNNYLSYILRHYLPDYQYGIVDLLGLLRMNS